VSEHEPPDEQKRRSIFITPETGSLGAKGEGLILRVHGPSRDGIRVSDSRGWTAAGDITYGAVENASAGGIPSEGEHLTLDTVEILVRRLNADGATWGRPVLLEDSVGRGVDCEAHDTRDRRRPPLRVQVTRPKMPEGFWKGLSLDSKVEAPSGEAQEAARSLWAAIEDKRTFAQSDIVLALNAIRTPWLALPSIVDAFRERYREAVVREGWVAIWVVGVNETFTERLDSVVDIG
jgi:hypothetical protein